MKNFFMAAGLFLALQCQQASSQNIEVVTGLPREIKEASACEISQGSPLVWTVEDQNNKPTLFGFNRKGQLISKVHISNVRNQDWEDLTSDDEGNMYVGDFGNNDNKRRNLSIHKINAAELSKNHASSSATVEFYYPEQKEFPPKKRDMVFDSEAFLYHNNQFYIFTKNRSSKFDGTTSLYRVKNRVGEKVAAEKVSDFVTCDQFNQCAVTGAAMSPDKTKVAILSSAKVWIFTDFKGDDFFSGKSRLIALNHVSQKEGLCFEDNNTLIITDEAAKKAGSNLYRLKL